MKIRSLLLCLAVALAAFLRPSPASAAEAADVKLSWTQADLENVDEFRVYELIGETWTLIRTVAGTMQEPPATEVVLTPVAPGVHTYRVTAANDWGESAPSAPASTAPPAQPPSGLKVEVVVRVTVSTPQP